MNRRDMLKGFVITGLLAPIVIGEGKVEAKDIQEERTRQYLDKISIWSPHTLFDDDDFMTKEYLFAADSRTRKTFLDNLQEEVGYALVYSPRHLIQKGHFFDIIYVKIGDKNVTAITELHKRFPGDFKRLPDCMNM